jgi:hypothetical protein
LNWWLNVVYLNEPLILKCAGGLTLPSPKERVPKNGVPKSSPFGEDLGEAKTPCKTLFKLH